MAQLLKVQCCIAGGGPAGMMLGYLLGRAGVDTLVLEKHADFVRDFRGDTVHPSTLRILQQLGLLEDFVRLPHSEIRALSAQIGARRVKLADFGRLAGRCNFIALMPQWDFLNFLLAKGRRFSTLKVMMSTQVTGLIESAGRVVGAHATTANAELEVRADLMIGCDGRSSTVRTAAALAVQDLGSPIDVLWFRLSKHPGDSEEVLGHVRSDAVLITINRTDYWQCAYVIRKGGVERVRAAGLAAFRCAVARAAPFVADRVRELTSFDEDVKLLSVSVDRLARWSKPGLLCIGDAAHAMSPVGGVGINLAIQDAVASANLLAAKLRSGTLRDRDLDGVRRRRLIAVRVIQSAQVAIQNRVLRPIVSGEGRPMEVPWPLKLLDGSGWLRRWPAQLIGVGLRPERVRSPETARS